MNKTELIEHIASKSDLSKAAAGRALESIVDAVKKTLKKGNTVTLGALVLSVWVNVLHVLDATHALVRRSRSKQPKCLSSKLARA